MMLSNPFEIQEEKSLFQVIFLKNDIYQSVWIEEVEEINFEEIEEHLLKGHSVFITSKEEQKLKAGRNDKKTLRNARAPLVLATQFGPKRSRKVCVSTGDTTHTSHRSSMKPSISKWFKGNMKQW